MKDKKLTMQDIAKMAGVGKTTVSRYFNGGYVKDETRDKIKKIIDEYHYQPNTFAQSLKAKETKIIGIIAPTLTSITSSRVLMSLDAYLKDQGYTPLIINTNHDELEELKSIEKLWHMRVDGIVLLATDVTMAHHTLLNKLDIPIVFLFQKISDGISILNDDYHAGYDIGRHVAKNHHKDIVFLGVGGYDEAVGYVRKKGVMDALKEYGIDHVKMVETDFTFDKTRKIVHNLLKRHRPSMIICATDNIALATFKELKEANIKVPEEVSLTGFGGYEISELITPSLCTIRFDNEEAGVLAGYTIIQLIKGESVDKETIIGYQFIPGESVKKLEK